MKANTLHAGTGDKKPANALNVNQVKVIALLVLVTLCLIYSSELSRAQQQGGMKPTQGFDSRIESNAKQMFTRPHGKRFGTLVHAVLSVVALDSNSEGIEEIAGVQGRVLGATDEEIVAAVAMIQRALQHPLLQSAAAAMASGNCRREVPVIMKLDDGNGRGHRRRSIP